ncbi:MAG: energy transducer TonB [Cognaticolwellia sp.]
MSADKFDNELSDLYQQSKQQTQVPTFVAENANKQVTSTRSPWHILALLLTGGVVSFGIMAVVTHFSTPSVHGVSEKYKQHSVSVVEIIESQDEAIAVPTIKPALPPTPASLAPKYSENSRLNQSDLTVAQPELSINKPLNQGINVPKINQPTIAIVPIHRVMPEYPKSALYARKSGTVKLQYRISEEGKVIDISGLNQHGDRELERSAKQALMQWRYPAENSSDTLLEIEFEFNLAQ